MIYRDKVSREDAQRLIGCGCGTTLPHCDADVCHAPGECVWCDETPGWQDRRRASGYAFTGHEPTASQSPCPSDARRGFGGAHVWPGNRPTTAEGETTRL